MSETTHEYKAPPQSKRKKLADQLSLVGDNTRVEILCQLFTCERMCVSAVADAVDVSVANASYHLNLLADAGLCGRQRADKQICYHTKDSEFMKNLQHLLCER